MKAKLQIDYPPRFAVRWGYGKSRPVHIETIFEANRKRITDFVSLMGSFGGNFLDIDHETEDGREPRWKQIWFPPLDGMSSYTMVAGKEPKRLIEIGSGNSTKFFARAKRDHGLSTEITSIDPYPREEIDALCDTVLRIGLEDVDLSVFDALESGDVVFFDGSHRAFQNSDVTVFFIDVLPRLPDGVFVGIHDIFWPDDYPEQWLKRYYNEQYMLATHMLAFGEHFPVVFSSSYTWKKLAEELKERIPERVIAKLPPLTGGCLWWEKKSVQSLA